MADWRPDGCLALCSGRVFNLSLSLSPIFCDIYLCSISLSSLVVSSLVSRLGSIMFFDNLSLIPPFSINLFICPSSSVFSLASCSPALLHYLSCLVFIHPSSLSLPHCLFVSVCYISPLPCWFTHFVSLFSIVLWLRFARYCFSMYVSLCSFSSAHPCFALLSLLPLLSLFSLASSFVVLRSLSVVSAEVTCNSRDAAGKRFFGRRQRMSFRSRQRAKLALMFPSRWQVFIQRTSRVISAM